MSDPLVSAILGYADSTKDSISIADDMSNPLVSVVIPTCRRAAMLARAVDSVLMQDYGNIEVIVADDNVAGSIAQRETAEVLSRYDGDARVRVVATGGLGGGGARNAAVGQAKGEYLAFLDDDDEYKQGKISAQVRFMLDGDWDMSYQDVEWYDESGKLVEHRRLDYASSSETEELLRQHILHSLCPTSIYMLRRRCFFETQGFAQLPQGQDWHFMLSCIEAGLKIGYMPGAFVKQYLHSGERCSTGQNKVEGENRLFDQRKRYFYLLDAHERRYVRFRHYAVLAFACKRTGWFGKAVRYGLKTIVTSPVDCVREARRYFSRKSAPDAV